jgi:excisionase family DNA binding protein
MCIKMAGVHAAESEWLTADEAAAYLKVKTRTLLLWVRQKKFKGTLSGIKRRVWRFRKADLDVTLFAQAGRAGKQRQ